MLQLRKGRPAAIAVPLGGGAVAQVRPATSFQIDLAIASAGRLLAGLIESQEAASLAATALGDEFAAADFTAKEWIEAASQLIVLLELSVLCVDSWSGVVDEHEGPLDPTRENLALLLRSNDTAVRVRSAIQSNVNLEIDEGNGLAASPSGGAAMDGATAPPANPSAPPAPMADVA